MDESSLERGLAYLVAHDGDLARIFEQYGAPPLWVRPEGFPTLVHIILEQQVSLASAQAAYQRLLLTASPLVPDTFLTLDDATLRQIGFSRQKAAYCRQLAHSLLERHIDLDALEGLGDEDARRELMRFKGIGPWTAEIYLLMALRRADAWPAGDLALAVAVQAVKHLPAQPTPGELVEIGTSWRPWRAVAARLLWHYYLSRPPEVAVKAHRVAGRK